MNFSFIRTARILKEMMKGWRILKMTAVALRPKNNFKAVKNRKRGGYVDLH